MRYSRGLTSGPGGDCTHLDSQSNTPYNPIQMSGDQHTRSGSRTVLFGDQSTDGQRRSTAYCQRVLLFSEWYLPWINGAVSTLRDVAHGLAGSGRDVMLYVGAGHGQMAPTDNLRQFRSRAFQTFCDDSRFDLAVVGREILEVADQFCPDLLFANDLYAALPALLLHRARSVPAILCFHETPWPPHKYIGRIPDALETELAWSRFVFRDQGWSRIIAPSEYFREWALACGADPARLKRHYFGVDLRRFNPDDQGQLIQHEGPVVVVAARVTPRKRLQDILSAASIVAAEIPEALFVFTWKTDPEFAAYERHLHTLIEMLDLSDNVRILADVEDALVPSLFRSASLSILASDVEGLGLALLEAQACGVPVIGTDVPGIREVVQHRRNGLLVPCGQPRALAAAALELLHDPLLRKQLSQAALCSVRSEFDGRANIRQLIAEFDGIASMSPSIGRVVPR